MSIWIHKKEKDGRRSLITAGIPIQLGLLILAIIILLLRC